MLRQIRNGADNIFIKIILGLVALSFIGVGGFNFATRSNDDNVVTFKGMPSISHKQFNAAKAKEITNIQNQNNITLTDENIAELSIDTNVLRKLIHESLIDQLAKNYDLNISDKKIIDFIKKFPLFKNKNNEFDLAIFKSTFNNSAIKEQEYVDAVKKHLLHTTLIKVFVDSFSPSQIMIDNMVSYMSETRYVSLFSINLKAKSKNYTTPKIPTEELKNFYQKNKDLFHTHETRSFSYIKVDKAFLAKKLRVSEKELKQYFTENREEFGKNNYSKVKKQIREILVADKMRDLTHELTKNLEDDVASGLTLSEITQKYALKLFEAQKLSLSDMQNSATPEYAELADSVFELISGELSYPIEVQDKNEIFIVRLDKIFDARQKSFAEVKKKITLKLTDRMLVVHNLQKIEKVQQGNILKGVHKLSKKHRRSRFNKIKKQGVQYITSKSFVRSDLPLESSVPTALLKTIFDTKKHTSTKIIIDNEKAYFAYINNVHHSAKKTKEIKNNSGEHFAQVIQEGILQELLVYLSHQYKMNIVESTQNN